MPVVAIAGAVGAVASGTAAIAAGSLLMGGLQIAGGVLGAVGAFTGNKKLAKIGAIAGLAGFAGAAMSGSGLFGAADGVISEGSNALTLGGSAGADTFAETASGFSNPMETLGPTQSLSGGTDLVTGSGLLPKAQSLVQNSALSVPTASSFKPTAIANSAPAASGGGMLSTISDWATKNPELSKILMGGVTELGKGLVSSSRLEEEMEKQKELALYKQQMTSNALINSRPLVSTRY